MAQEVVTPREFGRILQTDCKHKYCYEAAAAAAAAKEVDDPDKSHGLV